MSTTCEVLCINSVINMKLVVRGQYLKLALSFETVILRQGYGAYVHFYVALVQPPSNTMVAADDNTTVPSAHCSATHTV